MVFATSKLVVAKLLLTWFSAHWFKEDNTVVIPAVPCYSTPGDTAENPDRRLRQMLFLRVDLYLTCNRYYCSTSMAVTMILLVYYL